MTKTNLRICRTDKKPCQTVLDHWTLWIGSSSIQCISIFLVLQQRSSIGAVHLSRWLVDDVSLCYL